MCVWSSAAVCSLTFSSEVYRLNLEQGRFLNTIQTDAVWVFKKKKKDLHWFCEIFQNCPISVYVSACQWDRWDHLCLREKALPVTVLSPLLFLPFQPGSSMCVTSTRYIICLPQERLRWVSCISSCVYNMTGDRHGIFPPFVRSVHVIQLAGVCCQECRIPAERRCNSSSSESQLSVLQYLSSDSSWP